jgi:hypothetical protein
VKLLVSVDTEADNQWLTPPPTTLENIKQIPKFQKICDTFNIVPTYLVSYEVAISDKCREILLPIHKTGRAEIGAHLHPWTCPPFSETEKSKSMGKVYPSSLSQEYFSLKLHTLTESLSKILESSPQTYRAGRWGIDSSHLDILHSEGYIVDTSVTPLISWGHERLNYTTAPIFPYFPSQDDICKPGDASILEVPLTVMFTKRPHFTWLFLQNPQNPLTKLGRKLGFGPQPFRPLPRIGVDALLQILKQAIKLDLPMIHFMLHSSELLPGGSPYNKTPSDVKVLLMKIQKIIQAATSMGLEGQSISQFAKEWIMQEKSK